jgi:hypothetical protein
MALQIITKHYANPCDKPDCICEDAEVALFFRGETLTTDGKAFFVGTISTVTALTTGGVDVVIAYDDATLPAEFTVILDDGLDLGTVCDPDCYSEGSWVWKTSKMIGAGQNPAIISRPHVIYLNTQHVANNVFDLPRIPFSQGMRLTSVKITCNRYDANTTLVAKLKLGSTVIAQFTGSLAQMRAMTISVTDLVADVKPTLHIESVASTIYDDSSLGLVLELIGILIPE